MPDPLVPVDGIDDRADTLVPTLICSWTDGRSPIDAAELAKTNRIRAEGAVAKRADRPHPASRPAAAWVRVAGEVIDASGVDAIVTASFHAWQTGRRLILLRGPPNIDRMFTLTGSADHVEIGDVDPVKPPVHPHPETGYAS
jgi:hypothetical protein